MADTSRGAGRTTTRRSWCSRTQWWRWGLSGRGGAQLRRSWLSAEGCWYSESQRGSVSTSATSRLSATVPMGPRGVAEWERLPTPSPSTSCGHGVRKDDRARPPRLPVFDHLEDRPRQGAGASPRASSVKGEVRGPPSDHDATRVGPFILGRSDDNSGVLFGAKVGEMVLEFWWGSSRSGAECR